MKMPLLFLALAAGMTSPGGVLADREPDAETVREWVEQGKVLPLEELLDLEVEREDGRIVYELEVVDEQGRVHSILLDAQSGEWLGEEYDD